MTHKERWINWKKESEARWLKYIEELSTQGEMVERIAEWLDEENTDEDTSIVSIHLTLSNLTIKATSTEKAKIWVDKMMKKFEEIKKFSIRFTGWSEPKWGFLSKLGTVAITIEPAPQTPDCNLKKTEVTEVRWVCQV